MLVALSLQEGHAWQKLEILMKIYLVGGAVRDRLMKRTPTDFDYVAIGGSEKELRQARPGLVRVGKGFTVFVRGSEQYTLSEYSSIEEDLAARDLTVNAVAMDERGLLVAQPQALADLENRILRPVANVNFHADPLRAIRAARFAACWPDFGVHPDLLVAMRSLGPQQLAPLAGERVGQEVMKALAGTSPGTFLRLLAQGHCLQPWFDVVAAFAPSVLEDATQGMDRCAGDALAAWMLIGHYVATQGESARPGMTELAEAVRLPNTWRRAGDCAQKWLPRALGYPDLMRQDKVRLLRSVDKAGLSVSFWRTAAVLGSDHGPRAARDLERIAAVRLPDELCNLGPRSGELLRELQITALEDADV